MLTITPPHGRERVDIRRAAARAEERADECWSSNIRRSRGCVDLVHPRRDIDDAGIVDEGVEPRKAASKAANSIGGPVGLAQVGLQISTRAPASRASRATASARCVSER